MLFADLLSLHLVTFLMFFILVNSAGLHLQYLRFLWPELLELHSLFEIRQSVEHQILRFVNSEDER